MLLWLKARTRRKETWILFPTLPCPCVTLVKSLHTYVLQFPILWSGGNISCEDEFLKALLMREALDVQCCWNECKEVCWGSYRETHLHLPKAHGMSLKGRL